MTEQLPTAEPEYDITGPLDTDAYAIFEDIDEEDPNFDPDAVQFEDDSPYPEVRSAVSNTDDPEMPVNTFRAWVVGIIWAMIIPGVNQFFFVRSNSSLPSFLLPS